MAALQRLPPDQRAALVLSDVLEFPLTEVADILDCDVTEAGHLLLRARAGIDVPAQACADAGREAEVVACFTGAFERGDIAAIAALLAQDAWLRMRPLPIAYRGRAAARHFLSVVAFPGGTPGYRLVGTPSRANGQPAFGCYLRDPAATVDHACGLVVLTIDDTAASPRSTGSPTTACCPASGCREPSRPPQNYVVFSAAMFYNFV